VDQRRRVTSTGRSVFGLVVVLFAFSGAACGDDDGTSSGGTTGQGGEDAATDAAGSGGNAGSTGGSEGTSDGGCLAEGAPCNTQDQCCSRSCGGGGFTAQCR
jgi:hypothetical protein